MYVGCYHSYIMQAQMRMDDITKTDVETKIEPTDMESWKSQVQTIEKGIQ